MYSIILRVYYPPGTRSHPTGRIKTPLTGDILAENPEIEIEAKADAGIARVDVLGYYEGIDMDGDGIYREWHRNYHQPERGQPAVIDHHIGSSFKTPYRVTWDTNWIPDQQKSSIAVIARIQDNNGIWFVTAPVGNLSLKRQGSAVKMYKPYEVPERFSVRKNRNQKQCKFKIPEEHELNRIAEATIHFRTWHGYDGHHRGFQINSWPDELHRVGGKNHHYGYSCFPVPAQALQNGENVISFYSDTEHHGCEVLWPGPVLVVRYRTTQ
jgi:hypothetical protein